MALLRKTSTVSTSPFLRDTATTPKIMYEVLYTLIPVVAVSFYFFGLSAIFMVIAATAGCMATEWVFAPKEEKHKRTFDGSTLLTGVLLGALPAARLSLMDGLFGWRGSHRHG